ncbi:hypothetical protein M8J76_012092 [Diaphorina citri]|nr:hypothetical protein M8J76_006240 [Diaphorina citri]KAI5702187.1 hypothetical protein M8J76_012092 [Diaphorina citri]
MVTKARARRFQLKKKYEQRKISETGGGTAFRNNKTQNVEKCNNNVERCKLYYTRQKIKFKSRYQGNKAKILLKKQKKYQRNKDKHKAAYQGNKDKLKAAYQGNKDKHKAAYQGNKDKHKAAYQRNKDKHKAAYQRNKDKHKAAYQLKKDKLKAAYPGKKDKVKAVYQLKKDKIKAVYQLKKDKIKALYQANKEKYKEIAKKNYARTAHVRRQAYYQKKLMRWNEHGSVARQRVREEKRKRISEYRMNTSENVQNPRLESISGAKRKKVNRDPLQLRGHREKWIKDIMKRVKTPGNSSMSIKRLKAENLVKWALKYRTIELKLYKATFVRLKASCTRLLINTRQLDHDPSVEMQNILGLSEHTSSTENYYYDPVYNILPQNRPYEISERGILMDVFEVTGDKKWQCNEQICKLNKVSTVKKMAGICKKILSTHREDVGHFFKNFDLCSSSLPTSWQFRGHPAACHAIGNACISQLLFLRHLSPHFPSIRKLLSRFYSTRKSYRNVEKINAAITSGSVDILEETEERLKSKGQEFQFSHTMSFHNEDEIKEQHKSSFEAMTKRSQDLPIHSCMSCSKLLFRRDVVVYDKLRSVPSCEPWKELLRFVEARNLQTTYICNFCLLKFRSGKLPPTCMLNKLEPLAIPSQIGNLNDYEKLIIQRAKAFQTVIRMGGVSGRKQPHCNLLQKVVGRTFHLPLPTEQTLKKLPDPTQAIVPNQEIYVTVRGLPNKNKKIWQSEINVSRIYAALKWLKANNKLYGNIQLPSNEENLRHTVLESLEDNVFIHDEEDNEEQIVENDGLVEDEDARAMITQRDPNDSYYEQFTIQALHGGRQNETSTNLYQMLRVEEQPIDSRQSDLDLMCFPDLYPYGKNGLCEKRQEPLAAADFVKCKLLSCHSEFRLNIQYLFYLFHEANIRALKAGIYHKLNIVNKTSLTAGQCLQMLQNEELEGNLTTIFSRLRNSAQFWTKPRSDVITMITWYGPVTFFLTLSPSEYNWTDLDSYLRQVNKNTEGKSTSALVVSDPVSTSRFIDNKFKAMLDFIQADGGPLGKVIHYVWRREYQTRGLQHFHLLIWVENAPVIGESTNEEIGSFISKTITCRKPDDATFPSLANKVENYQSHRHNKYCMRSKKTASGFISVCRFAFPRPLSDSLVLRDVSQSIAGRRLLSKSRLYDLPRHSGEENVNDYNPAILLAWEGNMDIQFIGEKSCALSTYVTKYQTKAEKSNSQDTFDVMSSVKSLQQKLWNIAMRALSSRECGVMEACDTLLGISLFGTDKDTTIKWVDVSMMRSRKLKEKKAIERMEESSEDIFCPSMVDTHYPNRPQHFEHVCLFEFVRNHDIVKEKPKSSESECVEYPGVGYIKKRTTPFLIKHQVFNINLEPEKYFHSMLLLFKPWRKLEDLKGDKADFASAFLDNTELIETAIQHHERLQYLKKSKDDINRAVQNIIEQEEKKSPNQEDHLGNEAGNAMVEMHALNNVTVDEDTVQKMILSLNADQKRIFDHVKAVISDNSSKPMRHFVSGVGGTGKSYLIKTLKTWIKHSLNKMVAISAPTGVAAYNIEGITIHRLLQLPVEHGSTPEYKPLSDAVLKIIRDNMKDVVLLIIDEISMVSSLTLLYIHFRLSEVFDTATVDDGWFGRLHVLVLGDLLQLPPVMEEPPFKSLNAKKVEKYVHSSCSSNIWSELFSYDELMINVRQNKDPQFADILGRIRIGSMTQDDVDMLNARLIPLQAAMPTSRLEELARYVHGLSAETLVILPTRDHCRILNNACLKLLHQEELLVQAEDSFDCQQRVKKKAEKKLQSVESDSSRTAGLEKVLRLKLNCKIMLQKNLDIGAGLVNGSLVDEYNRLRRKFCPALPTISYSSETLNRQNDRIWKENKHVKQIQSEVNIPPAELICIPGFKNEDGVSCYANSTLQCLFHCQDILLKILEDETGDALSLLAREFVSQAHNLDTRSLRELIGGHFTLCEQQDSEEFFEAILNKYPNMAEKFAFSIIYTKICTACQEVATEQQDGFHHLSINITGQKSTLSNLFDKYKEWQNLDSNRCENCHAVGTKRQKVDIANTNKYLLITLPPWQNGHKITDFKLNALPSTVLKIANNLKYTLKSAIFHHGDQIESGHYTAMLKDGAGYIRANDNVVKKERWPNGSKDVYMVIMEKK